jgi:hypothetical protein
MFPLMADSLLTRREAGNRPKQRNSVWNKRQPRRL